MATNGNGRLPLPSLSQTAIGVVVSLALFLLTTEITGQVARINSLETRLGQLEGLNGVQDTRIETAATRISTAEQRVGVVENRNAGQDNDINALHVQLDTINSRGTTSADTRLSALETRVTVNDQRISRLEQASGNGPAPQRGGPN